MTETKKVKEKLTPVEIIKSKFLVDEDYKRKFGGCFNSADDGFNELIRVYLTYPLIKSCRGSVEVLEKPKDLLRTGLKKLGKHKNLEDNVEEFIKGEVIGGKREYHGHQWHLPNLFPLTSEVINPYLQDFYKNLDNYNDFETVYDELKKQIEIIKKDKSDYLKKRHNGRELGFGSVCNYDTSLRMVYNLSNGDENHRLMPHDYVYVHGKLYGTYRTIRDLKLLPELSKEEMRYISTNARIPIEWFRSRFVHKDFKAIDIEDFLCVMGEAIEALK